MSAAILREPEDEVRRIERRDPLDSALPQLSATTFSIPGQAPMVSFARGVVWGLLEGDERRDDAVLIASELITNAIRYSRSRFSGFVDVCVAFGSPMRIEVRDEGPLPPPEVVGASEGGEPEGGRGLGIVEALAAKWGVETGFAHALYWAELT